MKYHKGELPDQPEAKKKALEKYVSKQIQFRTKGRVLKYLTEFEFNDVVYDGEFINSETKETILWNEYGQVVINDVRTLHEDNTLICSALGKKYTMKSLSPSGGKIYAFI
tara:strand:- start:806 stop:1135 length:330 start_codon:yes stop_codon:yes gene_type:complete